MSTHRQRQRHQQRGAAAVEFAIVALVFFTLIFGLVDLGLGIFYTNMLSNAAREGARAGIINVVDGSGNRVDMSWKMCDEAVKRLVVPGVPYQTPNHTCAGYGPKLLITVTPPNTADAAPGDPVSMSLTYAYEPVTPLVQAFVGTTRNITAYSSMIKEH